MPRAVAATFILFVLGVVSTRAIMSHFFSEFVFPHVENNETLPQLVFDFITELGAAAPGVAAYIPFNITFDYS